MKVTRYLSDCIHRIFKGETDVITDAEAAGVELVGKKVDTPCLYVRIDETDEVSLYIITPVDGRFRVATVAERVPHELGKVFADDKESVHKASSWWGMVFIREDDGRIEAPLAEEFPAMKVCDGDGRNLDEFITLLKGCVGDWKAMIDNPAGIERVIIRSSQPFCVSLPLLYAIQEVFSLPVSIRTADGNTAGDVRQAFAVSDELLDVSISESSGIRLGDIINSEDVLTMTLPVNQFQSIQLLGVIDGTHLYDAPPAADYTVAGSLGFKRAGLRAFADAYGGVYITVSGGNTVRVGEDGNQTQILASSSGLNL